jgi:CheY-like chemotaxis protein
MAPTSHSFDFARPPALKPETFDVAATLAAILGMVRTFTGPRMEIRAETPAGAFFIHADPVEFDAAIVNILLNGRDAMNGDGQLTLTLEHRVDVPASGGRPEAQGEFVAISLGDTGCGIAEDQIDRIFEPFFTTKAPGLGMGLGLSQVTGFLEECGGEVRVESVLGQGSTFTLYLPRAPAPAAAEAGAAPALVDGSGLRVLLVDDNEDVGSFATEALTGLGYVTVSAVDARAALRELEKDAGRFDVVFTDVVMPGMSGIELGEEVRRRYHDLPVVLTSGDSHGLAQDGTHGFELLEKPYSIEDLSAILRRATTWRRRRRKWTD